MESSIKRIEAQVRRKTRGHTYLGTGLVLMRVEALHGMIEEVNKVLGTGGSLVWYVAGKGAGRSMAKILQKHFLKGEKSLESIFDKVKDLYARWGWGRVEKVFIRERTGEFLIRICDNAFAIGQHSRVPSCYYIRGYIEGLIETLTGKHVTSQETKCMAKGDLYCEFQITID